MTVGWTAKRRWQRLRSRVEPSRRLPLVARWAIATAAVWALLGASAAAQETASIELPATLNFTVLDVGGATSGTPTTVSYSNAVLNQGKVFRLSVRADAAAFTPPAGGTTTIPASYVSWAVQAAHNGVASNGTLSSASYALVFQGDGGQTSGSADLVWSLAAPGSVRAGDHYLTIRWKVESITP